MRTLVYAQDFLLWLWSSRKKKKSLSKWWDKCKARNLSERPTTSNHSSSNNSKNKTEPSVSNALAKPPKSKNSSATSNWPKAVKLNLINKLTLKNAWDYVDYLNSNASKLRAFKTVTNLCQLWPQVVRVKPLATLGKIKIRVKLSYRRLFLDMNRWGKMMRIRNKTYAVRLLVLKINSHEPRRNLK